MTQRTATQRTAAILAADVVGYTRLIAEAEEHTLHQMTDLQTMFWDTIARFNGRAFNTAGDAIRAEFTTASSAVEAALVLQKTLQARNAGSPLARQMMYRIGIADGDVVDQDGDVHGTPVTLATALEALASPGGLCVSRTVYDQISQTHATRFADLGIIKTSATPDGIHAYTLIVDQGAAAPSPILATQKNNIAPPAGKTSMGWTAAAAIGLAAVAGLAWLTQNQTPATPSTPSPVAQAVPATSAKPKPASPPVTTLPAAIERPSAVITDTPPAVKSTTPAPSEAAVPIDLGSDWPAMDALRKRHVRQCNGDDFDVAIQSCRALLKAGQLPDTSLAEIQASLGSALRQTGKIEESIEALTAAIKLAPDSATYNNRGLAHYESGKMDLAIEDFGSAIKLKPTDGDALNNRAWTQFKAGRLTLAAQDAKLATTHASGSAHVWDTSGHINEAMGNKQAAIENFRRALELDPKQEASRKGLARLQAKP